MTDTGRAEARRSAERRKQRAAAVPVLGQVIGLGVLMAGVYLTCGLGVALIVGGLLMVALSTLREAGWI